MKTNKYANHITDERRRYLLERRSEIIARRDKQIEEFKHRIWLKYVEKSTEFLIRNGFPYRVASRETHLNWVFDNFPLLEDKYLQIEWNRVPDHKVFYVCDPDPIKIAESLKSIEKEFGLSDSKVFFSVQYGGIPDLELKLSHLFEWLKWSNKFRGYYGFIICIEDRWAIEFEDGILNFGYALPK